MKTINKNEFWKKESVEFSIDDVMDTLYIAVFHAGEGSLVKKIANEIANENGTSASYVYKRIYDRLELDCHYLSELDWINDKETTNFVITYNTFVNHIVKEHAYSNGNWYKFDNRDNSYSLVA